KEVICNHILAKCWQAKSVIIRVIRVIRVLSAHTLNQPLNPNPTIPYSLFSIPYFVFSVAE
ncbi:MAG: hypothetical protein AB4426_25090, partial [Xenococcaceae cyanobacterium]